MVVSSYHYLLGPFVAVAALAVVCLLCRWTFSTSHREERTAGRPDRLPVAGDFGLLEPIAQVRLHEDAELLRDLLRQAGIRATVAPSENGLSVLVFHGDAARARDLVRS